MTEREAIGIKEYLDIIREDIRQLRDEFHREIDQLRIDQQKFCERSCVTMPSRKQTLGIPALVSSFVIILAEVMRYITGK